MTISEGVRLQYASSCVMWVSHVKSHETHAPTCTCQAVRTEVHKVAADILQWSVLHYRGECPPVRDYCFNIQPREPRYIPHLVPWLYQRDSCLSLQLAVKMSGTWSPLALKSGGICAVRQTGIVGVGTSSPGHPTNCLQLTCHLQTCDRMAWVWGNSTGFDSLKHQGRIFHWRW